MKKSSIIKLIVVVAIVISVVIVNGESFGLRNYMSTPKIENSEKADSIQFPNLLEEVTIIGKVPVK